MCGMAFASAGPHASFMEQVRKLMSAWLVATGGLILSASIAFVVLRRVLYHLSGQWDLLARVKEDQRFRALQHAICQKGFLMAALARFCPLPYCYTNLLLASLDSLSFGTFVLSTLSTAPRLLIPLFMGAKMYELSDHDIRASLDPSTRRLNSIFIFVSLALGVGSSWFIWRKTSDMLLRHEAEHASDEERTAFILDDVNE